MIKTTPQRAERCLRLLLGMRLPRVADALEPFGFSHAVIMEGWALMAALTPPKEEGPPCGTEDPPALTDQESRERLKDFCALWFPVVTAALNRHFPMQARHLFQGIDALGGPMAFIAVTIFVERLRSMQQGAEPFLHDGPAAFQTVESRGLSEAMLNDILKVAKWALNPAEPSTARRSAEREEQANQAMWAWYLEWSRIVRKVVTNKALLRSMGYAPQATRSNSNARQGPVSDTKGTNVRTLRVPATVKT